MDVPIELRQLRYFVAVAEELHFGRAADRLHMSQSPLSRAIRELERQLDVTLFVRTSRRVELTPAGQALLERARRALADVDEAVDGARRAAAMANGVSGVLTIGHGPLSRAPAVRLASLATVRRPGASVRLEEGVTPELLPRVATRELALAAVLEALSAARRFGVRIDRLRDEPLLAALPSGHALAAAGSVPLDAFVSECVLLPREPVGATFNGWLRAVLRTAGLELDRTIEMMSAPWDRRMLPVADGQAVSVVVAEWAEPPIPGVVCLPFDPMLTFPVDIASPASPPAEVADLLAGALRLRDREGWLTTRAPRVAASSPGGS